MSLTLREIADLVGGLLTGDDELQISGAETIRDARAGDITLADSEKLAGKLAMCNASAVIVGTEFQPDGIPTITVDNVHLAFAKIVSHFRPPREHGRIGVSPHAHISPTAKIGSNVDVYPGAFVDVDVEIGDHSTIHSGVRLLAGTKIGENVTIFPNAVIYEETVIGDRSVVHAGAVIGAYGFGYSTVSGRHQLSAQLGNVEIGTDVEIGACTTIDRGTYCPTQIGDGTKMDNQVMIAHNCNIGQHNLLCSQVAIAGSCSTGDYVVMAGQVGMVDHLHIGDRVSLGGKAGVMHDIPEGETYVGIPATPAREQMLKQAAFAKLPEMRKKLRALERLVEQLAADNESLEQKPEAA